ncbi:MAG: ABC transporter permease [Planctomycetota bacterium]
MNKGLLVALREYLENLRTKTFWIGILLFPLILVLSIGVPRLLSDAKDVRRFAVLDRSDWGVLEKIETRAAFPDMRKLLQRALAAKESGDEDFSAYPAAIRATAQDLATEFQRNDTSARDRDKALGALSEMFVALADLDAAQFRAMLPPKMADEIEKYQKRAQEIRQWYRDLDPDEAETYGRGLARGRYQRVDTGAKNEEELQDQLNKGEIFAYFVIDENIVDSSDGNLYVSKNTTDDGLREWFSGHARAVVEKKRFAKKKIDPVVVAAIKAPVVFNANSVDSDGAAVVRTQQTVTRDYAPVAFVYVLWIAVFTISQMLLTNTIEEKSNRIIEVLLSSISPIQLMFGKIAGIAATGLTVVLSWVLFLFIALKFVLPALDMEPPFDLTFILQDKIYLASFVAYFLMGYLLYAALLVGIGSVCNSLKEAQNLMTPVTLVLMIPLFAMFPIVQDPNGTLARVLSYVPPLTPFVMMNRAAGPPSVNDYIFTTILLVASIVIALWAAAKIFRVGILMTGKPPRLREILRWLRSPVGSVTAKNRD